MIETIRPRGAINEKLVVSVYEFNDKYFLIDDCGNRIEIPQKEFNYLTSIGVTIDEHFSNKTNHK